MISFYRYRQVDFLLEREFDACFALFCQDSFYFIHTQSFFAEVLLFWQNFLQAQEKFCELKRASKGLEVQKSVHGYRLRLQLDIQPFTLILPASTALRMAVIAEATRLTVNNDFVFSDSVHGSECSSNMPIDLGQASSNLLIDYLIVRLENLMLFDGTRLSSEDSIPADYRHIYFDDFSIRKNNVPMIEVPYLLEVVVARNLDAKQEQLPEMSVVANLNGVTLHLTLDTYRLIRTILRLNLGEKPKLLRSDVSHLQTTPLSSIGGIYINSMFRFNLKDVHVCIASDSSAAVIQGGRVHFYQAVVKYESLSDSSTRTGLICTNVTIETSSLDVDGTNDECLPLILNRLSTIERDAFMAELQYREKDGKTKMSVVFAGALITVDYAWLIHAYHFITAAPFGESVQESTTSSHKSIVFRKDMTPVHTISGMVSYRNSSESPFRVDATSVQFHGGILDSRRFTGGQLSNKFAVVANFKLVEQHSFKSVGLLGVSVPGVRFNCEILIERIFTKLSVYDLLVMQAVLKGFSQQSGLLANADGQENRPGIIERIDVKIQCCELLVIQHDSQRYPLAVFRLSDVNFQHKFPDSAEEAHNVYGSVTFSIDIFTPTTYKFEPLIEMWKLRSINCCLKCSKSEYMVEMLSGLFPFQTMKPCLSASFSCCLINETGVNIWIKSNEHGSNEISKTHANASDAKKCSWIAVEPDKAVSIPVNSYTMKGSINCVIKRLQVKVDGLCEISSVPIENTGTFYRIAHYMNSGDAATTKSLYCRIAFVVTLDEGGQKIVRIRSSLLISNETDDTLQLRFENSILPVSFQIDSKVKSDVYINVEAFKPLNHLKLSDSLSSTEESCYVSLTDQNNRVLLLNVTISKKRANIIWVRVWVPVWIVNKSGLPLVVKQDGSGTDSAGQYEEHERARSMTPLLFSFADEDAFQRFADGDL
ncbi:unnamed protein product [Soboliphyme baturini]|uniref:SHR-BD domain-containing protein n=1 Tax=Soboliphyme baturini TaxID=241478 RepID=A0A183IRV3_9BILA|nr:unnamed protein product [Soboliphyme baturini]